jgi:hypothetical protein
MKTSKGTIVFYLNFAAIFCCSFFLYGGGCISFGPCEDLDKIREETIFELDKAINLIGQESSLWRGTLEDLRRKFTHDIQQTIRNDVTELLNRSYV